MNDAAFTLAEGLVSSAYIKQAQQARRARESMVKSLLQQRRLPDRGWDDGTLQLLLHELVLGLSASTAGTLGTSHDVCVCVCVCEREGEERQGGVGEGERETEKA